MFLEDNLLILILIAFGIRLTMDARWLEPILMYAGKALVLPNSW